MLEEITFFSSTRSFDVLSVFLIFPFSPHLQVKKCQPNGRGFLTAPEYLQMEGCWVYYNTESWCEEELDRHKGQFPHMKIGDNVCYRVVENPSVAGE